MSVLETVIICILIVIGAAFAISLVLLILSFIGAGMAEKKFPEYEDEQKKKN